MVTWKPRWRCTSRTLPCRGARTTSRRGTRRYARSWLGWGVRVLGAGELALITGERTLTGTGLDGVAVTLTGPVALVARGQPDGTRLTAADQWLPYPGAAGAPARAAWPAAG